MVNCTFCGTPVPTSPQVYVERPDVEARRTELSLACPSCASGFPTKFTVR